MKLRRIGLLFGGPSPEHQISIASAQSVAQALNPKRFTLTPVYVDRAGQWWGRAVANAVLRGTQRPTGSPLNAQRQKLLLQQFDCVLPIFHGQWGEDGTIQAVLEFFGVPYVGSGVAASALGIDKARSRAVLQQAELHVPKTVLLGKHQLARAHQAARSIGGFPVVVKPNRAGSSVGISVARSRVELSTALRAAARYDTEVLIEQYMPGRELTVAVLSGRRPVALPVIEIRVARQFFDWKAKYADAASGETQELCPAPISRAIARRAQAVALTAHHALGCRGLTRTDIILSPHGRLTVLEVNIMPGLTTNSLAPQALRAAGISLTVALERLITEALSP